jgi:hypothetical protein
LRPLDFAIFVGSLDRHRPFHRRLPQVGDFHETVLVKIRYSASPQSFCRSHLVRGWKLNLAAGSENMGARSAREYFFRQKPREV